MTSYPRVPRRAEAQMTPTPVAGEPGLFQVDGTWGRIRPMEAAPGVRTIGELELIEHLRAGLPVVDTRRPHFYAEGTIEGATHLDHTEAADRLGELDRTRATVFFCNGPQCAATPDMIEQLIAAGHPAEQILYYRGGIHDWVTLGLPLVPGA
ncbi:MAG: rhodanese-like domain-containing protein [Thermoleophilia bacterium]